MLNLMVYKKKHAMLRVIKFSYFFLMSYKTKNHITVKKNHSQVYHKNTLPVCVCNKIILKITPMSLTKQKRPPHKII